MRRRHRQRREIGPNDSGSSFLLGLHHRLRRDLRLKASAARKVRFPSLRQLYGVGEGNTDLRPETSRNYEVGLLYHFDLTTYREDNTDHSGGKPPIDPTVFTPTELNTDQWLEAAQAAGAKYAIFTASHETGFTNWQSDLYPYGVKHTAWRNGKADIVGDFINSCHKYNIAPGLFIGLRFKAHILELAAEFVFAEVGDVDLPNGFVWQFSCKLGLDF